MCVCVGGGGGGERGGGVGGNPVNFIFPMSDYHGQ